MTTSAPRPRRRGLLVAGVALIAVIGVVLLNHRVQFLTGGMLIDVGYRLQDRLHDFDLVHHEEITPEQVWKAFTEHNHLAASMRSRFPRSVYHPTMAMLVCMDARIDTNELAADSRRNYYIVRTAGSVMSPEEEDMLELAVANGVKVLLLTRHTDCAAEKVAADPAQRGRFPALVAAVDEREKRLDEFLKRPLIAERLAAGKLLIKRMLINTSTDEVTELPAGSAPASASPSPASH